MLPPPLAIAPTREDAASPLARAAGPDPRLKPAAHEFEACLMQEFLEPLQHDSLFEGDQPEGGDAALMSFGSEALGKAISERGGFGIADRILRDLEKPTRGAGAPPEKIGTRL
jgi:peptidoglycan hydrolase FlgJ